MNRIELKEKLDNLGVRETSYSLYDDLMPGRIVLYHSYHEWQVFYFDERGGRNDEKIFTSEEEACKYIYKLLKEAKEIEDKYLK